VICAASLMPSFLFSLIVYSNAVGLIAMFEEGPSEDLFGTAHGWLRVGHLTLTTAFSMLICWLCLIRRSSSARSAWPDRSVRRWRCSACSPRCWWGSRPAASAPS